jgi:hypothetical protein
LDNEVELGCTLEWFESEDPEEEAEVIDALGRRVSVKVEAHRVIRLELVSPPSPRAHPMVTERAQPWFFWLSWCEEPAAPWTNIRLPPRREELLALTQPAILESWTPRTRFGAWVYGSPTRTFSPDEGVHRGRFYRIDDFAAVQAVHAGFAGLGEETKSRATLVPMERGGTLPLDRVEIDMLEERIRTCPAVAESFITRFDISGVGKPARYAMRGPIIFLGEDGIDVFRDAAHAVSYAEAIDVVNGLYGDYGWDTDGRRIAPPEPHVLLSVLLKFWIERDPVRAASLSSSSLEELIASVLHYTIP